MQITLKLFSATSIASLLLAGSARAAAVPIPVTGFNQDVVVEVGAPANATGITSATMDGGNTGGTWYEQGFNAGALLTGLPAAGTTIISAAAADHSYTFPSSYGPGNGQAGTTPNAFVIGQGSGPAIVTLTTPLPYLGLSLIGSAGHGPNTVDYTVTHADATTETGSLVVGDWFNGTPVAFNTNGRVSVGTGAFDNVNANNPRLYSFDFALSNTTSPVTSLQLSSTSTSSTAAFFALSGTPVPEPTSLCVLAVGGAAMLARRRRGG
jgi:hypothetical protein